MFLRWLSFLDYVSIYSFIIIIDSKRVFFVIYSRYQLKSGNFLQRNKKKNLVLSTEPLITIGYVLNI